MTALEKAVLQALATGTSPQEVLSDVELALSRFADIDDKFIASIAQSELDDE